MVHEMVGRQIDDVAAGLGSTGCPGDGVEQMRLAQADGRMHVDRIEADGAVEGGTRHLLGDAERDLVAGAGHEAVEGHLGIERRPRQCVAARRHQFAMRLQGRRRRLGLDLRRRLGRGAEPRPRLAVDPDCQVQPGHRRGLGTERLEDTLGIIGLYPGTEEPRRHRQMREIVDDLFEFETREPAGEDVFTHPGPQPCPDALKQLLRPHHRRPFPFYRPHRTTGRTRRAPSLQLLRRQLLRRTVRHAPVAPYCRAIARHVPAVTIRPPLRTDRLLSLPMGTITHSALSNKSNRDETALAGLFLS